MRPANLSVRVAPVVWAQGAAGEGVPADPDLGATVLPPAGEAAALARSAEVAG
jgi:hypothetical protein